MKLVNIVRNDLPTMFVIAKIHWRVGSTYFKPINAVESGIGIVVKADTGLIQIKSWLSL